MSYRWTEESEYDLRSVATEQLVEELKTRDGVDTYTIDPYDETEIPVDGPAIVFVITD